jgi:hypothetical protein
MFGLKPETPVSLITEYPATKTVTPVCAVPDLPEEFLDLERAVE